MAMALSGNEAIKTFFSENHTKLNINDMNKCKVNCKS